MNKHDLITQAVESFEEKFSLPVAYKQKETKIIDFDYMADQRGAIIGWVRSKLAEAYEVAEEVGYMRANKITAEEWERAKRTHIKAGQTALRESLREAVEGMKVDPPYPNASNGWQKEISEDDKIHNATLVEVLSLSLLESKPKE